MKKKIALVLAAAMVLSSLTGCSKSAPEKNEGNKTVNSNNETSTEGEDAEVGLTGEIRFAINRSEEDIELLYKPIAEQFMSENPDAKVELVMAEKDANVARTQLNAGEFPDVSIAPRDIPPSELSRFYLPIGDTETLSQKYQYAGLLAQDGKTYALPNGVTHAGVLYNKAVLDTYLEGKVPTTLDEWYKEAETLKANDIIPLWTNAGAKWPMAEWDRVAIAASGEPGYRNSLLQTAQPWAEGTALSQLASIIETFVKNDWIEEDTVLEQWDASRKLFAEGKVGFMLLGSWAVPQLKDVAATIGKNPEDIGFAPIPYKNNVSKDNKLNVMVVEDMMFAINKDTKSPELAIAFLEYFLASDAPAKMGLSSPIIGGEKAEWVQTFDEMDYIVEMQEDLPDDGMRELCNKMQLDVFIGGTYLIKNIIEPIKNGKEVTIKELNELWEKNVDIQ